MVREDDNQRFVIGIFQEFADALIDLAEILANNPLPVLAVCPPGVVGIHIVPQLVQDTIGVKKDGHEYVPGLGPGQVGGSTSPHVQQVIGSLEESLLPALGKGLGRIDAIVPDLALQLGRQPGGMDKVGGRIGRHPAADHKAIDLFHRVGHG